MNRLKPVAYQNCQNF